MSPGSAIGADILMMTQQQQFPSDAQLAAYLLGELRGPELASVAAWAQDPANAEYLALLQEGWEVSGPVAVPGNLSKTLAAVREHATSQTGFFQQPSSASTLPAVSRYGLAKQWSWARRIAFGTGLGVMALLVALGYSKVRHAGSHEQIHRYTTGAGEQLTVTLPDQSTATLAPRSELSVGTAFGSETRTVALQGEAVFQVRDQASIPFIVNTGAIQTRVLGTRFAVRAYRDQGHVQVFVEQGKVATYHRGRSDILTAGMIAFVTDSGASVATLSDLKSHIGWDGTKLAFKDVSVTAVLSTLGRWYGYEFRLTDSTLTDERVSTVLSMSKRDETLRALGQLLDVTLSMHDTVITLTPRRSTDSTMRKAVPSRRETGTFFAPTEVGK